MMTRASSLSSSIPPFCASSKRASHRFIARLCTFEPTCSFSMCSFLNSRPGHTTHEDEEAG